MIGGVHLVLQPGEPVRMRLSFATRTGVPPVAFFAEGSAVAVERARVVGR